MGKRDAERARWKAICARTRAAQAQIDAFIKGVKVPGTVIVKGEPRRPPLEEPEIDVPIVPVPMAPPIPYKVSEVAQMAAKSVRTSTKRRPQQCTECHEYGHNSRKHVGEPRCVHGLPWKSCPTCGSLKIAGVAAGSAASATTAP